MKIYIALFIEKITTLAFRVLVHFFDEKKLEKWKPIHLCWWFIKNDLQIPPYFIGKINAPTVTGSACTSVSYTSATGNGNITATGGANATTRGFCYMVGTTGDPTTANSTAFDTGSFGTGAYTKSITGLTQGTSYRVRAYAINSGGTGYGTTVQLTTTANTAPTVALNTANAYDFGTDTTPTVNFTGTDTETDAIEYNIQIDTTNTFNSTVGFGDLAVDYYPVQNIAGSLAMYNTSATKKGQSFLGTGDILSKATFRLSKIGSPTGNVIAYLYAHTGTFGGTGTATGSPLATSASVAITSFVSDSLVDFDFSASPYTLANGTPYVIVVEYTGGDASNNIGIAVDNTPTHAGSYSTYTSSWAGSATYDVIFYVYTKAKKSLLEKTSAVTLDASYDISNADVATALIYTSSSKYGQSFISKGGILKSCNFGLFKTLAPTGTAVVRLYGHSGTFGSGGLPVAPIVSSDPFDVTTLGVGAGNATFPTFTFSGSNRFRMTEGTAYFIVLEYLSGNASNYISVRADNSSPSHPGQCMSYTNTPAWALEVVDLAFSVYAGNDDYSEFTQTGHPFPSGVAKDYTVQTGDGLASGTYYWRARAIDPSGSNNYGAWSGSRTFVVAEPAFTISGTSDQTTGTAVAKMAVNGVIDNTHTATIAGGGTWTISGATRPSSSDAITVFISNSDESTIYSATAVTTYSGTGSIGSMVLNKHVLTIGSDQNRSIVLSDLAKYDYDDNNRILHSCNGSPATLLAKFANGSSYVDEKINILAGNTLTIGATETLSAYDVTIDGTMVASGAATLNINHNWVNNGTFTAGSSTVTLNGTATQALSGTLNSTSAFYNLTITNNSGASASDGERTGFTPSVDFNAAAKVTNNYTITTANVRVEYQTAATYEFANINWNGQATGSKIYFRNSDASTTWLLKVTGTQTAVSYVNVSRSDASVSGGTAISAFDGTNLNSGNNTSWTFVNTRVRQEINLINGSFASLSGSNATVGISKLDPGYGGTLSSYFEVVTTNTDSVSRIIYLRNWVGDTIISQITIPSGTSSPTRFRSSSFTFPVSAISVYVNITGTTTAAQMTVTAARVIVIQDTGSNPITATETQIEIGNYESAKANTTAAPLTYPKYWYYNAARWSGTPTFYAEVSYASSTINRAVTITLQKDNGGNFSFSDVVTIQSAAAATASVPLLTSRVAFTPVEGCNYQIAAAVAGGTYSIYSAKIAVIQSGGGNVVKFEPQYLVANTYSGTTGLKNIDTSWDTTEWGGVSNTYYHEINSSTDTADSAKLQSDPNGTPVDVTGSTATGAYRARSTALTMPATNTLDTYILNTPIYASRIIVALNTAPEVVLNTPTEGQNADNNPPTFNFTGTDPSSDDLEYNVQIDASNTFNASFGNGDVVLDYHAAENIAGWLNMYNTSATKRGQSFLGTGDILSKATFRLNKTGSPTGNVIAYLYAHTGTFGGTGTATGSPLATSASVAITSFVSDSLVNFDFSASPYTLANGTPYVIIVEYTGGDVSNAIGIAVDNTPTHAGSYSTYTSSWVGSATYDVIFYVYKKAPAPLLNITTAVTLDDTYNESNASGSTAMYGASYTRSGQSFISKGGLLDSCKFSLYKLASPTGTVVARLYEHSGTYGNGGIPVNALVTSDTINVSTLPPSGSPALITFTFSGANKFTLIENTKYFIVLEYTGGDASNYVGIQSDSTSPTHDGQCATYANTNVWATQAADVIFYVYVGASDAGFTTGNPFSSGSPVDYTAQSELTLTTGYWRVRAIDSSGSNSYGDWSETRSFTIDPPTVVLNTPTDTQTIADTTPTLNFTGTYFDVIDAIEYDIQVDTIDTFDSQVEPSIMVDSYALFTSSFAISGFETSDSIGQSFTPSASGTLLSASWYLAKNGAPTGSAVAKIYAYTGTFGTDSKPIGTALATSDNYDVTGLTVGTFQIIPFTFSGANRYELESGVHYVLAVEYTVNGGAGNNVRVGADTATLSHAGNYSSRSVSAGTWVGASTYDSFFRVYTQQINHPILDKVSITDTGFTSGHPFDSNSAIDYTVQTIDTLAEDTYYWRVKASSGGSAYGDWSAIQSFTIQLPTVALNTPTPAEIIYDATPTLNFTGTEINSGDLEYNIQIDPANTFDSLGWDLSTGSYANISLSTATEETSSRDLAFSADGTKAYVIGTTQYIYQYTLPIPWDISIGVYSTRSLFVGNEETSPCGLAFSADGTKAYVVGTNSDTIFQYTLTTPWDVGSGSGSYSGKSLSVTTQDIFPHSLTFSADGTKAYVSGINSDYIYQYTLTTPWDVSPGGSYSGNSLSVGSQDGSPIGLAFSSDGTTAYIAGDTNNTIYQYTLASPWVVSSGGSYSGKSLFVGDQDILPHGISFSTDGTKAYVIGDTNDTIYQYNLGTTTISKFSAVPDAGFLDSPDQGDTHPFTSATAVDYTVQSGNVLVDGTYYWRARACLTGGTEYGSWSSIQSFTVSLVTVALNTPTDAQTITDTTPALNFTGTNANTSPIEYNLQIDTVNTFDSGSGSGTNIIVASYPTDYSSGFIEMHVASPYYTRIGQSFDSGNGGILAAASFKLGKSALTPPGTVVAKLYAHTGTYGLAGEESAGGGVPTGSPLATSATITASTLSTGGSFVSFDFSSSSYTLVAGTKYVIDVEYVDVGSDATHYVAMYIGYSGICAGLTDFWINNLSKWVAISDYDTRFYVYVKGPYLSEFSLTDAGFLDSPDQGDTHPFTSATAVEYTVQSALSLGTYYWRVAGMDPAISTHYSAWSTTQSFILAEAFVISGTTSNETTGTIRVAVNGNLQAQTGSFVGGTWTIEGVAYPASGDSITVFISDATSADISTAVTTYNGTGSIGGMVLDKHVLSIGSDQNRSIVLSDLANYDYDQDTTHILHSANGSPATLLMKFANGSSYVDEKIDILTGNTLSIGATETLTAFDLTITGNLTASGASTINVARNWTNSGLFTASSSTVTLNGTVQQTVSGTLNSTSAFYNLTITNNSGVNPSDNEITDFVPSVTFSTGTGVKVTNDYTINAAHVRVSYHSGYTYEFANINWAGTSGAGNQIYFRNSDASTTWLLKVTGDQTAVSYVNVSRSDASVSGGNAIIASDGTDFDAGSNTSWLFINTRFRQEINILDSSYSTSGDSGEIIYIDPAKYGGTLTYKFEIVAMVTSGTGTVTLHDVANNVHATISVTATSFTRSVIVCSTVPTVDSYHINLSGGTGLTVQAARVIVLQDFGENAVSATETQIEIGDTETKSNTSSAALNYPKYWLYTAANWNGSKTFYAEVAYAIVTTGSVTVTLQKDVAGDLATWSDVITIVSAQTQTVPTLSSRVSFTPVDGCNYQIAAYISANNYTIYNAKIVVDQAGGGTLSGAISSISAPTYYIDATTAGESTNIFGVIETAQRGIFVKSDGTRGYFLTNTTQTLYQADFGTAWDMSTATYSSAKFTTSGVTSVYAPFFKPDGYKLYLLDDRTSTQNIFQYSVSTAWDLGSSVTSDKNQALPGIGTELAVKDLYMTDDGTKAFVAGSTNSLIYAFSFSTAWDVATIAYVGSYSPGVAPMGIWFAPNGMKMYVASATTIYQYTLSTAWTITSGVTNDSISGSLADAGAIGLCFSPNMSKLYAGGATDDRWNEFNSGVSYSSEVITISEPQYLLQNTYKNTTGLQNYDAGWVTSDWQGVSNTYYHEIDLSSDTADSAKLQYDPNGTPTDVTGSSATGTAYRSRSSAMTMSASQTIDTYISNVPIYASRIVVALQIPSVPTVTTPTATSVAIPNATLGATITSDGGIAITARGTCWGTSPSPTTHPLAEGGTSTGVFSHSRTGITAGTVIYYRGYATNSKGTAYSEDGRLIPGPNEEVQYDSDHVTKIAIGGTAASTSVFLDFSTTATNATEEVTPKVEVRAIGSAFTGTATHTGDAFNFSPDSSRMRNYPAVVYDAPNHRFVVFGGKDDAGTYLNDTWELKVPTSSNPNPIWRLMSPSGTPPSARNSMVYVYDSVAYRMIIFGGTTATGLGGFYSLDLSSTDGAWSSFTPSGTVPTDRFTSTGIFDSTNRRMIVFGGYTTVDNNDTYSITLPDNLANSASTQLSPGGTIPTARSEHVAIFDSANQRMIVFGGWGASFYNDVKSLSLTSGTEAWVAVTVNGSAPNVRSSHVAIYDSVNQRMVTGLGRYQAATVWYSLNDIYSLSIPTGNTFAWTDNTAAAGSLPAKRHAAAAAYDSDNERAMIFGGFDRTLSIISNETLSVDVSSSTGTLYCLEYNALTNLTSGDGSEAIYDSYNKHMVRFGGYGHIFDLANPDATGYHHAEVWAYCIDTNSSNYNYLNNITPSTGPLAGEVSAVVYDSNYRRLVRFGSLGYNQDQSLNDTWTMSLDPARSDYHVWVRLTTTGGPPGVRWGAANIFDPVNSRMIVFGGCDNGWTSTHYNDVWLLSLPDPDSSPTYTWTSVNPSGTPPSARFQSTGIYDSTNVRMLVFGGRTSTPTYLNDLWELNWDNGTPNTFTWTDRTPSYTPALTGRRGHTTEYDSTYNRMIMFGGYDGGTTHFDDVWSFDVSSLTVTATKITISGTSPVVRRSHNAIFDPDGQRMIIQGGRGGLTPTNFLKDFWKLTLPLGTSGWTWTELNPINYLKTSVSVPTLTNNTGYHWQAWATGSVSGDTIKVSYGGNLESVSDFIVGTLSASTGIKVWNGTDWVYKPVKVYIGGNWVAKPVKVWDSGTSTWVTKG